MKTRFSINVDHHRISLESRPVRAARVGFDYETFARVNGGEEFSMKPWAISRWTALMALAKFQGETVWTSPTGKVFDLPERSPQVG